MKNKVLILDFGSQYTQLIARRLRELGFYSFIIPGNSNFQRICEFEPKAIILSGGPSSVYENTAPKLVPEFWPWIEKNKTPLLGICYGLQLIVQHFQGKIAPAERREYGCTEIEILIHSHLFEEIETPFEAWMSHGDETLALPLEFMLLARSVDNVVAGIAHESLPIYGVQFHPEVTHTYQGTRVLQNFLERCAALSPDWKMNQVIEEQIQKIKDEVPADAQVICGLSGGVDSTVAAILVHQALGDRLHCVFVDTGLLRYQEGDRVMKLFTDEFHLPVIRMNAEDRFLSKLKGVSDPEQKRKAIGAEFIAVFDDVAKSLESKLGKQPTYLVQGTLYPDVIESSPAPSAEGDVKHSHTIKSHHNVGGLPRDLKFKLIEPFRDLFKDEVREIGRQLGVPASFIQRHPFPGPGLAVRVLGEITKEKLDILRLADELYINALQFEGLYDKIWQAMAILLPVKTVGVQGDARTHDYVVALRAVTSTDGMTADFYPFDMKFLAKISRQICNEVRGINRVTYDVTSKPPATIEWE